MLREGGDTFREGERHNQAGGGAGDGSRGTQDPTRKEQPQDSEARRQTTGTKELLTSQRGVTEGDARGEDKMTTTKDRRGETGGNDTVGSEVSGVCGQSTGTSEGATPRTLGERADVPGIRSSFPLESSRDLRRNPPLPFTSSSGESGDTRRSLRSVTIASDTRLMMDHPGAKMGSASHALERQEASAVVSDAKRRPVDIQHVAIGHEARGNAGVVADERCQSGDLEELSEHQTCSRHGGTQESEICVMSPFEGSDSTRIRSSSSVSPATPELASRSASSPSLYSPVCQQVHTAQVDTRSVECGVATALAGVRSESSEGASVPSRSRSYGLQLERLQSEAAQAKTRQRHNSSASRPARREQCDPLSRARTRGSPSESVHDQPDQHSPRCGLQRPRASSETLRSTCLAEHEIQLLYLRLRHAREQRQLKRKIAELRRMHKDDLAAIKRKYREAMDFLESRERRLAQQHDDELQRLEESHLKQVVARGVKLLRQWRQRTTAGPTVAETRARQIPSTAPSRLVIVKREREKWGTKRCSLPQGETASRG
ncbi:conserved hypothetical protein [Neospora caninum Liverpool]|nr:conserved hypothetical protein [Neospora caninum Liverpool]CBZ52382.1 conserved hypothetical protein [Neospora caninum Liverpool]|eukprot:XP_003882414.1 conserved hypothetical protein [Neospora caninum Liverpool]